MVKIQTVLFFFSLYKDFSLKHRSQAASPRHTKWMNMLHSKHYPLTSRWLRTDSNRPTWPTYYSSNPSNTWWWGRGVCFWKKEVFYYLDLGSHHMNLLPHQNINKIQLLQSRPGHNKNRTELQKSGRFVNQNIGCASVLRVATKVMLNTSSNYQNVHFKWRFSDKALPASTKLGSIPRTTNKIKIKQSRLLLAWQRRTQL